MLATSVAARSRGKARRVSRAAPAARMAPGVVVRGRVAPLSPRPGAVRGGAVCRGGAGSWNQASQQKLNAQLTMICPELSGQRICG
jgi:hypothetical protein